MAWSTPINWAAKAVGYLVTRADLQTISDSLNVLGECAGGTVYQSPGWFPDFNPWVYVSASSFKVVGANVTGRYPVGTKLLFYNTSTKTAYAISTSYAGGDTTVNIVGDALANAAITNPRFSYAASPYYFPARFSHTPATVGWAATPTIDCDFAIEGRQLIYYFYVDGTSNSTSTSLTLPVAASVTVRGALGGAVDASSWVSDGYYCVVQASSTTLVFYAGGLPDSWASIDHKTVAGQIIIPI